MRYLSFLLLTLMSIVMLQAQEIDKEALRMAVERQLVSYPESTLQDVYKAFYQEHFGPEHMISDTAAVRQYLDYELSIMGDERTGLYMMSDLYIVDEVINEMSEHRGRQSANL